MDQAPKPHNTKEKKPPSFKVVKQVPTDVVYCNPTTSTDTDEMGHDPLTETVDKSPKKEELDGQEVKREEELEEQEDEETEEEKLQATIRLGLSELKDKWQIGSQSQMAVNQFLTEYQGIVTSSQRPAVSGECRQGAAESNPAVEQFLQECQAITGSQIKVEDQGIIHLPVGVGNRWSFKCQVCSINFETKTHWESHMRTHSEGGRQLRCKMCHKTFGSSGDLMRHEQRHWRSKPF